MVLWLLVHQHIKMKQRWWETVFAVAMPKKLPRMSASCNAMVNEANSTTPMDNLCEKFIIVSMPFSSFIFKLILTNDHTLR